MRILQSLVFFLIVIAVFAGGAFLVAREVLLFMGAAQIRSSLSALQRVASNTGSYIQECRKKGINANSAQSIQALQLRFVSPTEYVTEVICAEYNLDPLEVTRTTLPPFVTATQGSSGVIWGEELSGVGVQVFGRKRAVLMEGSVSRYGSVGELAGAVGPVTTCAGHGFACCQEDSSQGVGTFLSTVSDCPRSCYAQCQPRPVILALTTQPFYDPQTRVTTVGRGETVDINYVVDVPSEEFTVTLAFGDGQQETFTDIQGGTSHVYTCAQAQCQYELTLRVATPTGLESAVSTASRVTVVVQ